MRKPLAVLMIGIAGAASGCAPQSPPALQADRIVVEKSRRQMHLMRNDATVKTYRIALGGNPLGHKQQEGDSRTPEGGYVVDTRNPQSRFHLSLRVSYPSAADRQRAARRGVSPGGDIFIHGTPNGAADEAAFIGRDWTDGCIAVTNAEIREIWAAVGDGTPIEIRP
ncbi:MAG: L,D-transpeptidase family protein [Alphaproteobacteria bacterium]